jgi:hypothetical protein
LKGTSLTDTQIAELLTKGDDAKKAPHKKAPPASPPTPPQAVATFVKTLK